MLADRRQPILCTPSPDAFCWMAALKILHDGKKWTQAMKNQSGSYLPHKEERSESSFTRMEPAKDGNNIEGILMALHYLSLQAVEAGLIDLANILEEAAQRHRHHISRGERL